MAFSQRQRVERASGDRRNEGVALVDLGIADLALGEATSALTHLEDARAILRDCGDERSELAGPVWLGRRRARASSHRGGGAPAPSIGGGRRNSAGMIGSALAAAACSAVIA